MAKKTISPGGSVSGVVELPGDKSISHRYAILAALAQGRSDVVVAVFLDQAHQFGAIELVGMHALQCLGAAPLPMLDQIAEQLGWPSRRRLRGT